MGCRFLGSSATGPKFDQPRLFARQRAPKARSSEDALSGDDIGHEVNCGGGRSRPDPSDRSGTSRIGFATKTGVGGHLSLVLGRKSG